MATKTDKTTFRGIGILDPRFLTSDVLWAAESSYNQAGPRPGVPEPQQATDLVLKSTGTQAADSSIRLRLQRGGYPGTQGAAAIWRPNAGTDWYGWQPPYLWRGYEWITANGGQGHHYPALVTLQNGDVLQLGSRKSGNTISYDARLYDADTATWSGTPAVVESNANQANLNAGQIDAVQLPDGTILAFALVEDTITGKVQCNALVSTDSGASWDEWKRYTFAGTGGHELASTTAVYRLRVAYQIATGEILLCLWYENGAGSHPRHMQQWASRDLGHTFTWVGGIGDDPGSTNDQSVTGDVIAIDGGFQVWSANPSTNASVNGLEYWALGSAFDPITAGNTGQAYAVTNFEVSNTVGKNQLSVTVTDDGLPFVLVRNIEPTVDNMFAATIGRGGYRGGVQTSGYGSVLTTGSSLTIARNVAAAFSRGRLIVVSNHDSIGSTTDENMLTALYFGGASTVTHGYTYFTSYSGALGQFQRTPEFVAGWERAYLPWNQPDNDNWTLSASGTTSASISIGDGLLGLTTTGTGTRVYRVTPTAMGERSRAWGVVNVSAGIASIDVVHDDGSANIHVRATVDSSGVVRVYDDPTTLRATLSAVSMPAEVLLEVDTSTVKVWARGWDSSEIVTWEDDGSGSVTDLGAADGTGLVQFGCDGGTDDAAKWYAFAYSSGVEAGESLIDASYPGDLHPFPVPAEADGTVYLTDGVRVYAADGPGAGQAEWLISTRYDFPIERILPTVSPSPSLGWRSSSTAAGMAIAWKVGDVLQPAPTHAMVYIDGINWRQAQLQYYNPGTSSWVDFFEIQAYIEFDYSRSGKMVYPSGANTSGEYLHFGEAIGGTFEFSSTKVRKVTYHTSGALIGGADTAQPYLYCEDVDDTEPSSGTGKLWLTRVCLVLPPMNIAALRLQINDDASPVAPPEGYYTIGSLFFGSAQLFGTDYSFGRTLTIEANTEITTARDGRRRSRVNGPARRSVTFAFPAIDTTRFSDVDTPDLIQTWEYNAVTQDEFIARDEPVKLPGILEYCNGPDKPVVYLPRVDRPASAIGTDAAITHKARGAFLGRLTSPVTLTQVAGDESKDEVLSIGSITIEEEV